MSSIVNINIIANYLSTSDAALRLLLTILAGYPLAGIYCKFLVNAQHVFLHLYFFLCGIALCYFNYGFEVYHSFLAILLTYIWINVAYKSRFLVFGSFIFHMMYLLGGYYFTESDDYDIKWTMPHCVLVLRLIGLTFDISDGRLAYEKLTNDQKRNALPKPPSLLELFGFSYFPASFIVGPQYPFRQYEKLVNKEFINYKNSAAYGLKRGALGILYLLIRQIGSSYIPDNYLLSSEFQNAIFFKKLIVLMIWAKLVLYKYVACWLLTEGALACFGLPFVKISEDGQEDWSGCSNVNIAIFEKASKLAHYVPSFNVNTNNWVAMYIYKRLKFLGNRMFSQAAALLFLAVWHGFHSGYYLSFFFEFSLITFERQFEPVFEKLFSQYNEILESSCIKMLTLTIRRAYTLILLAWCLIPFVYFNHKRWMEVFSSVHYYGIIFLLIWYLGKLFYMQYTKLKPKDTKDNIRISNDERAKTE